MTMTTTRSARITAPLLLAAAIGLEFAGLGWLPSASAAPAIVAGIDGTEVAAAAAVARPRHAASVEVRVLAQASIPAN